MSSKRRVRAKKNDWRTKNPEKAKARDAAYRSENAKQIKIRRAARYKANPDKAKTYAAKRYVEKKEEIKVYAASWRKANKERKRKQDAARRAADPEKSRAYSKKYRLEHPEADVVKAHNRRVRKINNGGKLSKGIIQKLLALQRGKCAICKKSLKRTGFHLDHIVPICRGGKNTDSNTQLTCPTCNMKKGGKDPIRFMQEQGYLL